MSTTRLALVVSQLALLLAVPAVSPAAAPPGDAQAGADAAAPEIRDLRRNGRRVTYRLSEGARVNVVVARLRSTDPAHYLRREGREGRNRLRMPRGLRRGDYRLVVVATDEAGNRSQRALKFRVA